MADQRQNAALNVQFRILDRSLDQDFLAVFPSYSEGLVRSDPGRVVASRQYAGMAEQIYKLGLRSDDVWVVTFPKCGQYRFF